MCIIYVDPFFIANLIDDRKNNEQKECKKLDTENLINPDEIIDKLWLLSYDCLLQRKLEAIVTIFY